MPGGAVAGLEGDTCASDACGGWRLEERIDADRAGEPIRRARVSTLSADALDFHSNG